MIELKVVYPPTFTRDDKLYLQFIAITNEPYEACGVIHADGRIIQYPNTFDGDLRAGFDMEIDVHDDTITAIWHTHPRGLQEPSKDDLPCIELLARHGFDFHHVIVTSKDVVEYEAVLIDQAAS